MRFIVQILTLFLFLIYTVFISYDITSLFNDCDIPNSMNNSSPVLTSICPPDPKCYTRLCEIEVLRTFIYMCQNNDEFNCLIEMSSTNAYQFLLIIFGIIVLFWLIFLHLSMQVQHVNFNTNLNLYSRKTTFIVQTEVLSMILSFFLLGLLIGELQNEQFLMLLFELFPNFYKSLPRFLFNKIKFTCRVKSLCLLLSVFSISVTPITHILSLVMFQFWSYSQLKRISHWLSIFLILISNDIHMNPGPPYHENFFNFMLWNLNSLAKKFLS